MILNCCLFRFEVSRAEGRRKLLCDLAVPHGVRLAGDAPIASVQGVVPNLDEQLEVLLLREVYVWPDTVINMLDAPRWFIIQGADLLLPEVSGIRVH